MIDTLRLNLVDCEIKKSCPLKVQPGIIDFATGRKADEHDLFVDTRGRIITGVKAFLNDDKFNLTINPTFESELDDETGKSHLYKKRFKRILRDQTELMDEKYEIENQAKGIFFANFIASFTFRN